MGLSLQPRARGLGACWGRRGRLPSPGTDSWSRGAGEWGRGVGGTPPGGFLLHVGQRREVGGPTRAIWS